MKISRIALSAAVIVLALALVPLALAGKGSGGGTKGGGGGGGGTTSGGGYSVTVSPAGPYTFGETVDISSNAPQVSGTYINLACYQNGALVGSWVHADWSAGWYYGWGFVLGPTQSWLSGSANCTVTVTSGSRSSTVASTSFSVSG